VQHYLSALLPQLPPASTRGFDVAGIAAAPNGAPSTTAKPAQASCNYRPPQKGRENLRQQVKATGRIAITKNELVNECLHEGRHGVR
jgi:hypothetical protein